MAIAPVARLRDAAQDLEPALHRAKFAVPVAPRRFVARERLLSEATAWGEVTGSGAAVTIVCAPVGRREDDAGRGGGAGAALGNAGVVPPRHRRRRAAPVRDVGARSRPHRAVRPRISTAPRCGQRLGTDPLNEALRIAAHGEPLDSRARRVRAPRRGHDRPPRSGGSSATRRACCLVVIITNHDLDLPARFRNGARDAGAARRRPRVHRAGSAGALRAGSSSRSIATRTRRRSRAGPRARPSAIRLAALAAGATCGTASTSSRRRDATTPARTSSTFERVLERHGARPRGAVIIATSIVDPVSADARGGHHRHRRRGRTPGRSRTSTTCSSSPSTAARVGTRHRHPMRELLRAELAHRRPDDVVPLHRRAARWFDDARLPGPGHGARDQRPRLAARRPPRANALGRRDARRARRRDSATFPSRRATVRRQTSTMCSRRASSISSTATRVPPRRGSDALARRRPRPVRSADTELLEGLVRLRLAREGGDSGEIDEAAGSLSRWCWNHPGSGALVSDVSAPRGTGARRGPARRRRSRQGDRAPRAGRATRPPPTGAIARSPTRPPPSR